MKTTLAQYAALLLGSLVLTGAARAFDQRAAASKLPPLVVAVLQGKFPQAKIVESRPDDEGDGQEAYEIQLLHRDRRMSLEIAVDGTILEIERRASLSEVPYEVEKAIHARLPQAKVEKIDVVVRGERTFYEVDFQDSKAVLVLDAQGKTIAKPPRVRAAAEVPVAAERPG